MAMSFAVAGLRSSGRCYHTQPWMRRQNLPGLLAALGGRAFYDRVTSFPKSASPLHWPKRMPRTPARSCPLLGQVLTSALPDESEIERRGGLFQREKPIRKVTVTLGDHIYTLEDLGRGPLAAARAKVVRGITLKTEPMPVEDWLADLSAEISRPAPHQNEKAFFALKNLLD